MTQAAAGESPASAPPPAQPSSLSLPVMDNRQQRAILDSLRERMASDIESMVETKADLIYQRGKQMFTQLQTKHKERLSKLGDEVGKCCEKQRALEAENEKLKQGIQNLASRFSMLGDAFNGSGPAAGPRPRGLPLARVAVAPAPAGGGGDGVGSLSEPCLSPPLSFAKFAPECGPAFAAGTGADPTKTGTKLPDVPLFPFSPGKPPSQPWQVAAPGASPSSATAPLLLSEVLGTQTPQRTPLSLLSSLAQTPVASTSPRGSQGDGHTTFSFTLRKAEGADLGLNLSSHADSDRALRVDGIRRGSATEAYNRQCLGSLCPEKAIMPGDEIIKVNDVAHDVQGMLIECRDQNLLKFHIMRADCSRVGKLSSALRADASIFVPMSTVDAAPPPVAKPEEVRRLFQDNSMTGDNTPTTEASEPERPPERVWLAPKAQPQAEAKVGRDE